MTKWINQWENKGSKPKKLVSIRIDEAFITQAARFAGLESARNGFKIGHATMYQTLLSNEPAFRAMLKAEKEAYANTENQEAQRTDKEDRSSGFF